MPLQIIRLYRMGVFEQSFSFGEFRYMVRIFLFMHAINCGGHLLMKYWTRDIFNQHIKMDDDRISKKRELDDYVVQKNYFRSKKQM